MADNSNVSLAINQPHHRSVSADEFSEEQSALRDRQTQIGLFEDVLGSGGLDAARVRPSDQALERGCGVDGSEPGKSQYPSFHL